MADDELFKTSNHPSALKQKLMSTYSVENFLNVWRYMRGYIDIDGSAPLGQFYCKSRHLYSSLCSTDYIDNKQ
jgi:hypothetical protein